VELDLAREDDATQFRELLSSADVLVSNLRPGTLARLGQGVDDLRRAHPRLIVCEISGFGTTGGPYASWPAFDSVIQGMSGLASLQQDASGRPALAPMGSMDILSGVYAAFGIVTALAGRARTGVGTHVDAAMYDIGAAFLERPLTLQEFTGRTPVAGADDFSPVGTFQAGDGGWVSIVIPTDEMWRRCCAALGRPDLESDPELDTVLKRAERMTSHVLPLLELWAADKDRFAAVATLQAAGQPAGVVQTVADVRNCPQLAHRGLFAPFVDRRVSEGSDFRLPRSPLLFDGEGALPGPVPDLGQDNEDVLGPD
jgi:CoA:oxalate CoA-transferase